MRKLDTETEKYLLTLPARERASLRKTLEEDDQILKKVLKENPDMNVAEAVSLTLSRKRK